MFNGIQMIGMARNQIAKRIEAAKVTSWNAARRAVKGQKDSHVKASLLWNNAKEGRELVKLFNAEQLAKGYVIRGGVIHRIAFNGFSIWTENVLTGEQNRLAEISR